MGRLKARDGSTWDPASLSVGEEEAAFAKAYGNLAATPEAALEGLLGPLIDRLLLARGIADVDAETREALLAAFQRALGEAFQARQRNAGGDFAADKNAGRFPAWPSSSDKASAPNRLTLPALVELWWTEAKAIGRKPATYSNYKRAFEHLARYLGHDDARRVTAEDIVGFKAWRLASVSPQTKKPISPLTIRGNELGGLKTIFAFAVASKLIPVNPALGVSVPRIATVHRSRSKSLSDAEALALLEQASSSQRLSNEMASTAAARRHVPWLLAFTGARVGEMCQLRKEDVRLEGNHWVITITPEAGTVKGNAQREVVIHPQVIEQGFLKFVDAGPVGHLFLNVGPKGRVLGVLKGLKTRLAYCAREVVTDPLVAPQHGWRHRFKTVGMATPPAMA
jgi:integrase